MINQLIKDRLGKQLFAHLNATDGAWESGLLLTAQDLLGFIDRAPALEEGGSADPLKVLGAMLVPMIEKTEPILAVAVSQKDGSLIVWGDKLTCVQMADESYRFAMFGEPLPESVKLSIYLEKIGPVGKEYRRPYCALTLESKNNKGKKIEIGLDTAIAGNFENKDGAYAAWANEAVSVFVKDQDENDLLDAGLIAPYTPPKLGQGGGPKTSLYKLAEAIDEAQDPQVYRLVSATLGWDVDRKTKEPRTDSKGNGIPTIAIKVEDDQGEVTEFWPEVAYDWRREIAKGGYGWSDAYLDWLEIGRPVYLLIVGLKPQMRWNAAAKEELPVCDREGNPRYVPNMGFRTDIPKNLAAIGGAARPKAIAPVQPLDERAANDQSDFDDIPF